MDDAGGIWEGGAATPSGLTFCALEKQVSPLSLRTWRMPRPQSPFGAATEPHWLAHFKMPASLDVACELASSCSMGDSHVLDGFARHRRRHRAVLA